MASYQRHLCINVTGMMENYKRRKLTGLFQDDDGSFLSDREARAYLAECKAKGWRVIPMSGECEGFDYQTGCPGHRLPDPVEINPIEHENAK